MRHKKPIPFKVDRTSATKLTDQVVDGFKRAILSGYYAEGEYLPTFQEVSDALGVSLRIPRDAVERLAKDNFIAPRQRVGSLVLPRGGIVRRGLILAVLPSECEGSYYPMVFIGELRRRLMSAGWLFTCVTVDRRGRTRDYSLLENMLAQKVDFVVTVFCSRPEHKMLESAGVPFLIMGNENDAKTAADTFYCSFARASEEFVARCRRTGVKRIVFFEYGDSLKFFPAIGKSDMEIERVRIEHCPEGVDLAEVKRQAIDATLRRFGGSSPGLPDVIFIADDYVAEGVLVALATLGVRIPEDVRLVTVSNRGRGPVSVRDLSRFEVDPIACGRVAANGVLTRLDSAERCGDIIVESSYIGGDTFPD